MNRTRQLKRAHTRILGVALGVSLLAHGAALALIRFDLPAREIRARTIGIQPDAPSWSERAVRLVRLDEPKPEPLTRPMFAVAGGGATPSASASAGGATATAPAPGGLRLPASASLGPGFSRLRVIDPRSNSEDLPVSFADLRPAEAAQATAAAEDDQPYEPGSIGRAKRQWAGAMAGDRDAGPGRGRFVILPGDGHCPMPGRGGRGPLWTQA